MWIAKAVRASGVRPSHLKYSSDLYKVLVDQVFEWFT